MSAETVVQAMIRKRIQDKKALKVAYEDVIATLEAGVKEMGMMPMRSGRSLNPPGNRRSTSSGV